MVVAQSPDFLNLISIYQIIATFFFFSPIIIYYFKSKSFQIELKLKHYIVIIAYSLLGEIVFLAIEYISREPGTAPGYGLNILQTPSEFIIANLIFLFFYYMFQSYSWNIIYAHEVVIPTESSHDHLVSILKKTNDLMGAKLYYTSSQNDAEYYLPGSFYTRFDQFIQELDEPKGFKVILINSARNLRYLSIFQTILILPLIIVRSNQIPVQTTWSAAKMLTLYISISTSPTQIDVVWWFLIVGLIFLFYGLTLGSSSENVLLKFEETFKKARIDQALNLPSLGLKKPGLSLDDTKNKLTDKKDSTTSKLEDEKRKRVDEVMGILNPKKEETKQMDPDVLRLEALIFTVRTVLQATPTHRQITLDELYEYFNKKVKTTPEEIESIVFGLIQRQEVEGSYNIWDKMYSGGTPARRFVDRSLEHAEDLEGELSTIKVKADGSVEFYFNTTNEGGNEASKEDEDEDESDKVDKFDSF